MSNLDTTIEKIYADFCKEKARLDYIERTENAKKAIKFALAIAGVYNFIIIMYRNGRPFHYWNFEEYYKWLETHDPLRIAAKRVQQKAEAQLYK